jgi:hypothetical protein
MAKENKIYALQLYFIIICLFVPFFLPGFLKIKETKLDGDIPVATDIELSSDTWFSGAYTNAKTVFLNENFNFHNAAVRLKNQINFTLFNKPGARDVIVGKQGYLFEEKYLKAYTGMDYIGDKKTEDLYRKIKFIQDTLEKKGIFFALLYAPGKATFYPEYIPSPFEKKATKTNYLEGLKTAERLHINFIDFNNLFVKLKKTCPYPLYPQTGTHWSVYGSYLAFDSLTKYMANKSKKEMAHLNYTKVVMSDSLLDTEGDLEKGLNLIYPPKHYSLGRPFPRWEYPKNCYKPSVLTVSDSYWMCLYNLELPKNAFSNHACWYYNVQLYNYAKDGSIGNVVDADLKSAIEKNNFIFIMSTEASLGQIGWGFIQETYALYKNGPLEYEKYKIKKKKDAEMTTIINYIEKEETWLIDLSAQAKALKITLDSCIYINAAYIYSERHKNDPK